MHARAHTHIHTHTPQVRELGSRVEYLRVEREKLLKVIAGEQAASSSAKQSLESLAARVRSCVRVHVCERVQGCAIP